MLNSQPHYEKCILGYWKNVLNIGRTWLINWTLVDDKIGSVIICLFAAACTWCWCNTEESGRSNTTWSNRGQYLSNMNWLNWLLLFEHYDFSALQNGVCGWRCGCSCGGHCSRTGCVGMGMCCKKMMMIGWRNAWSMKLRVQDQGEDQRGPGKRLFERTVKHVSWIKRMPWTVADGERW